MTPEAKPAQRADSSTDSGPGRLARLLALSGIVFAVLLLFGWFLSAGDTPDYTAANEDWIDWAEDNGSRSGIRAFLMLLAGFVFLHFAGTIREVLGSAEIAVRGSAQLARVSFAAANLESSDAKLPHPSSPEPRKIRSGRNPAER